jgi:hypothetical protein
MTSSQRVSCLCFVLLAFQDKLKQKGVERSRITTTGDKRSVPLSERDTALHMHGNAVMFLCYTCKPVFFYSTTLQKIL